MMSKFDYTITDTTYHIPEKNNHFHLITLNHLITLHHLRTTRNPGVSDQTENKTCISILFNGPFQIFSNRTQQGISDQTQTENLLLNGHSKHFANSPFAISVALCHNKNCFKASHISAPDEGMHINLPPILKTAVRGTLECEFRLKTNVLETLLFRAVMD